MVVFTKQVSTKNLQLLYIEEQCVSGLQDHVFFSRLESRSQTEPVGAGCFCSLEQEPLEKKTRSRSRLENKSGVGAAKK